LLIPSDGIEPGPGLNGFNWSKGALGFVMEFAHT